MGKWFPVLCTVSAILGCGHGVDVAKDGASAQVDSLLREIAAQRKKLDIGLQNVTAGMEQLTKEKVEAKVKLNQITEKLTELQGKIDEADKSIARLRDYLKENKDVTISGKTYTPTELREMADDTVSKWQDLSLQAETLKTAKDQLGVLVASFEQRQQEGRERLRTLKRRLEEVDAKAVTLKSIRDTSAISGRPSSFDTVEKQVRDLSVRIDMELATPEKSKPAHTTDLPGSQVRQRTTGDSVPKIETPAAEK